MAHVGFIEDTKIQKRLHESSLGATGLDSSYTEKERRISHTTHYVVKLTSTALRYLDLVTKLVHTL